MDRLRVYEILSQMGEAQVAVVAFLARAPTEFLPSEGAPKAKVIIQLVAWAEQEPRRSILLERAIEYVSAPSSRVPHLVWAPALFRTRGIFLALLGGVIVIAVMFGVLASVIAVLLAVFCYLIFWLRYGTPSTMSTAVGLPSNVAPLMVPKFVENIMIFQTIALAGLMSAKNVAVKSLPDWRSNHHEPTRPHSPYSAHHSPQGLGSNRYSLFSSADATDVESFETGVDASLYDVLDASMEHSVTSPLHLEVRYHSSCIPNPLRCHFGPLRFFPIASSVLPTQFDIMCSQQNSRRVHFHVNALSNGTIRVDGSPIKGVTFMNTYAPIVCTITTLRGGASFSSSSYTSFGHYDGMLSLPFSGTRVDVDFEISYGGCD